jgi:hypothetical protein
MSDPRTELICGEGEDFFAVRGWCSAKALLKEVLDFDTYPSTLREIYGEDYTTPLAELRKQWTAATTRGWMRPADPTETVEYEWECQEEEGNWYVCEKDHPQAEKWTYWST